MKNKHLVLISITVLILAGISSLIINFTSIGNFFQPEFNNPNLDELPKTTDIILEAENTFVKVGNQYVPDNKYKIGDNLNCRFDCAGQCVQQDLKLYKAYSRKWGECMCKCLAE